MIIALLVFLGLQIFSGWTVISCLKIKEKLSLYDMCAMAYGIGMDMVSIQVFFILLFGLKISLRLLFSPRIILSIINVAKHQIFLPYLELPKKVLSKFEKFLVFGISFEVIYAFFITILYPMES